MQNWQCSDNINITLKLYRSILVKYRYTSLELAVRSAALMAYPIARCHTCNLLEVRSSDHSKEPCHRF